MAHIYPISYKENITIDKLVQYFSEEKVKSILKTKNIAPFAKITATDNNKIIAEVFYSEYTNTWVFDENKYSIELCHTIGKTFKTGVINLLCKEEIGERLNREVLLEDIEKTIALPEVGDRVIISFSGCRNKNICSIYGDKVLTVKEKEDNSSLASLYDTYILMDNKERKILNPHNEEAHIFIKSEFRLA